MAGSADHVAGGTQKLVDEIHARLRQAPAVNGEPLFKDAVPLSKETINDYLDCGRGFISILNSQGNDKESMIAAVSALVSDMQIIMAAHAKEMTGSETLRWGADVILLVTIVKVILQNPMWGSEALALQMANEFEKCLRSAKCLEITE